MFLSILSKATSFLYSIYNNLLFLPFFYACLECLMKNQYANNSILIILSIINILFLLVLYTFINYSNFDICFQLNDYASRKDDSVFLYFGFLNIILLFISHTD